MPKFKLVFAPGFLEQHADWIERSPQTATKIDALVKAIHSDPFKGIGKPEPMRWGPFKGCWSRRITREHRLVYKVEKDVISFLMCRYHY
jgi:toxin YoeB